MFQFKHKHRNMVSEWTLALDSAADCQLSLQLRWSQLSWSVRNKVDTFSVTATSSYLITPGRDRNWIRCWVGFLSLRTVSAGPVHSSPLTLTSPSSTLSPTGSAPSLLWKYSLISPAVMWPHLSLTCCDVKQEEKHSTKSYLEVLLYFE